MRCARLRPSLFVGPARLACEDRNFRHDALRPWWRAKFVITIEREIERLENAGFVVLPSQTT